MLSKTNCEGCIFKSNGCSIGKKIDIENSIQSINGFCRLKRGYKWLEQKYPNNIIPINEQLKKDILDEEQQLAVIIIIKDISNINGIVNNLIDNNIQQIIFSCKKQPKENLLSLAQTANKRVQWTIDNIVDDNLQEDKDHISYSSRLVKPHWFLPICNNEIFSKKLFNQARKELSKNNNYLYFADTDAFQLINKFAFYELGGNNEQLFKEKIRNFENWSEIACQIY